MGICQVMDIQTVKRAYSLDYNSPTVTTCTGGHRHPKFFIQNFQPSVRNNVIEQLDDILESRKDFISLNCTSGFNDNKVGLIKAPTVRANNPFLLLKGKDFIRRATPLECARLQTIRDNFKFDSVSNSQKYKMMGNGFTITKETEDKQVS